MVKLTLSVERQIVQQAKHRAVDVNRTVSSLVEEGLKRVLTESRQELRTIAQLTLRAAHHFPDAVPFIVLAILAFRDLGIAVDPQRTGLRLRVDGKRYVVDHKRVGGQQMIRIHPWGKPSDLVESANVTDLKERLGRVKRASEYAEIVRALWRIADHVRAHARGAKEAADGQRAISP